MKFFNNLKIGKKLIIAFLICTLLASAAGIISVCVTSDISNDYTYALNIHGFSQGTIGTALAGFLRVSGYVHDAVGYFDENDLNNAIKQYEAYVIKTDQYIAAIEETCVTEEGIEEYKIIVDAWGKYKVLSADIVSQSHTFDVSTILALQKRMVNELEPLRETIYSGISDLLKVKIDKGSAIDAELNQVTKTAIIWVIIILIIAVIFAMLIGTYLSKNISSAIKTCVKRLELLAEGDLRTPVPQSKNNDETGILTDTTRSIVNTISVIIEDIDYMLDEMANGDFTVTTRCEENYVGGFNGILKAIRHIRGTLSSTLLQIDQAADQVSSGADQVSNAAQVLSQGSTEQAASIEELSATITDMTKNIRKNANDAREANEISADASKDILASNDKMDEMMKAMDEISEKSSEVNKIIKSIDDIAFQTNILALNAAVEAARAGAAGKGFAVVADEVRNLAQKSANAASNTAELIEATLKAIARGDGIAKETAAALHEAVSKNKKVTTTVMEIASASEIQATSAVQINTGIDQIAAVVQTNSATAQESAAESEEFSGQAQTLKNLIRQFTLASDDSIYKAVSMRSKSENKPKPLIVEENSNNDSSAVKNLLENEPADAKY